MISVKIQINFLRKKCGFSEVKAKHKKVKTTDQKVETYSIQKLRGVSSVDMLHKLLQSRDKKRVVAISAEIVSPFPKPF